MKTIRRLLLAVLAVFLPLSLTAALPQSPQRPKGLWRLEIADSGLGKLRALVEFKDDTDGDFMGYPASLENIQTQIAYANTGRGLLLPSLWTDISSRDEADGSVVLSGRYFFRKCTACLAAPR